jgi:crotonobetainyl-CoA:carnitine CoA-transferase CaiB-like acyl-CoA transferase
MKNQKPLADIRVLAIEPYGAGPRATLQLADLGAEILKIESPAGDVSRYIPPGAKDGDSLFYQCFNRNKIGKIRQTGPAFKFSGYKPDFKPGSSLGKDTKEILMRLAGYRKNEISDYPSAFFSSSSSLSGSETAMSTRH